MVTYNFKAFADTINAQFIELCKEHDLFVTSTTKEDIYDTYLQAFPEGTNPIYKTRREYDCSTCKQFIRAVGSVVAIIDGSLISVWDVQGLEYPYDVVAQAMAAYVKAQPIASTFCVKEVSYGAPLNRELLDSGGLLTWHHFHARIPSRYQSHSPGQAMGDTASTMQVMERGLEELSLDAINTVLELIADKKVYRGEEHLPALLGFKLLKEGYNAAPNKEVFLWSNLWNRAARLRNSAIGTLVQAISEGEELDAAVHSFGSKMEGYKRPKSPIINPSMRNAALATIQEMGLEPSLYRRHARIGDVSINDVLWVDGTARPLMKGQAGSIAALLDTQVKGKAPTLDRATPIGIEEFMSAVLPAATSLEILLENRHLGNLMSITAPTDPEAPRIFKWGNGFGWSYKDNVADSSIKQKVKSAGGNVTAPLLVRGAWDNYDDLDIHVWEPGGSHINFSNKRGRQGGVLDVDANGGSPKTRTPVENVCWTNPPDGTYKVEIHNYCKRESIDVGFTLEVESLGSISTYHYPLPVGNKEYVKALTIVVKGGQVTSITPGPKVEGGDSSKEEWGLKTQSLVKVDTVMLSPNYWSPTMAATQHWGDSGVGNKHWFFIIHGCLNPEPIRGLFNEQLRGELDRHRKVFEVLGDLTKVPYSDEQLSGLGFSSTRKDKVKVLVSKARAYEISF